MNNVPVKLLPHRNRSWIFMTFGNNDSDFVTPGIDFDVLDGEDTGTVDSSCGEEISLFCGFNNGTSDSVVDDIADTDSRR